MFWIAYLIYWTLLLAVTFLVASDLKPGSGDRRLCFAAAGLLALHITAIFALSGHLEPWQRLCLGSIGLLQTIKTAAVLVSRPQMDLPGVLIYMTVWPGVRAIPKNRRKPDGERLPALEEKFNRGYWTFCSGLLLTVITALAYERLPVWSRLVGLGGVTDDDPFWLCAASQHVLASVGIRRRAAFRRTAQISVRSRLLESALEPGFRANESTAAHAVAARSHAAWLHAVLTAHDLKWYIATALWCAATGNFCKMLAGVQVPSRMNWKEEFQRLGGFNRKILTNYYCYIGLMIAAWGTLTIVLHSDMMRGERAALWLAGLIAIFWTVRVIVDFLYFKPGDYPHGTDVVVGKALLSTLFILLLLSYWALIAWHALT